MTKPYEAESMGRRLKDVVRRGYDPDWEGPPTPDEVKDQNLRNILVSLAIVEAGTLAALTIAAWSILAK